MGFAWAEDISVGAAIGVPAIEEIRTNVDTVDDEKCAADKISYDNDGKDGDETTYNPGYQSDYKDGDDASHNPGYYYNQHNTYKSSNYPADQTTYDTSVLNIAQTGKYVVY